MRVFVETLNVMFAVTKVSRHFSCSAKLNKICLCSVQLANDPKLIFKNYSDHTCSATDVVDRRLV